MKKNQNFKLRLKFWGVRGSTPTPQIENLSYGGNTPCLEIRTPENEVLIFDGGTGVRNLGDALTEEFKDRKINATFFLTHYHWDHIQGIPFFRPLYNAENEFVFHSFRSYFSVKEMLEGQMKNPYFPVDFDFLPSRRSFIEIDRDPIKLGKLTVYPFPMNHPDGARGYRIEYDGASIIYATDVEHGKKQFDFIIREFSQSARILIYDAQFTPEEYVNRKGWGHSTWLEGTKIAKEVNAEQLILFHHDPSHSDQIFFEIVQDARKEFENSLGAKEGWIFEL